MTLVQALLTTLGILLASGLTYLGARFTARSAHAATSEARDAQWNAAYRAAAEQHLQWDLKILTRLSRVEASLGLPVEEIPAPPPLFPSSKEK